MSITHADVVWFFVRYITKEFFYFRKYIRKAIWRKYRYYRYHIRYIVRVVLRLSRRPIIVIIKLLLRYIIRSESIIMHKWAGKYPTFCYYVVKYNEILPFLFVCFIRTYTFVILNEDILSDILHELKILDSFIDGYVFMEDKGPPRFSEFINSSIKDFDKNSRMPETPEPKEYNWAVGYDPEKDSEKEESVVRKAITENIISEKSTLKKNVVENTVIVGNVVEGPATEDDSGNSKRDKGKGRMPTQKEYELQQQSIKEKLSISNLIIQSYQTMSDNIVGQSEKSIPVEQNPKRVHLLSEEDVYAEDSPHTKKRARITEISTDERQTSSLWDRLRSIMKRSTPIDSASSSRSKDIKSVSWSITEKDEGIKAASSSALKGGKGTENTPLYTKGIKRGPGGIPERLSSTPVFNISPSPSPSPDRDLSIIEKVSTTIPEKANSPISNIAVSSTADNLIAHIVTSPLPEVVRSPDISYIPDMGDYIIDSDNESRSSEGIFVNPSENLSIRNNLVEERLENNTFKEYVWVSQPLARMNNISKFCEQKLPKIDIFTFGDDYLEAKKELISPIAIPNDTGKANPPVILGNRFKDGQAIYPFLNEYSIEKHVSKTNAFINLHSYFKNVDLADNSGLNMWNLKDKGHLRDINRVFNNYYSPGYIPKDVYWNLWIEDSYKFLLESKFAVDRLSDGRYKYTVEKLSLTLEEKEVLKKEHYLLNKEYPENDRFNYLDAYTDQEAKIKFYGENFRKGMMDNKEWLLPIDRIDGDLNGSSPIFREWSRYNLREALTGSFCVLDKHNIVTNPIWKYGLQDRRWFGQNYDIFSASLKGPNNPWRKDDEEYRVLYNLPSATKREKANLEYLYGIDQSSRANEKLYTMYLPGSILSDFEKDRLDKKALMVKSAADWAFENNPLYKENFKGESNRSVFYQGSVNPVDRQYRDMPSANIETTLRTLNKGVLTHGKMFSQLAPEGYDINNYGPEGQEWRNDNLIPETDYLNPNNVITSRIIPQLKSEPWVFTIPETADGFTDDCYIWENPNCRGLVPKERTYVDKISKPDYTRFVNAYLKSDDPNYPNGLYIMSKHTLKDIFSEYEQVMKLTKETCALIDKNNILLYFNLFQENQKNLCLSCADKVVIYNRELCESIQNIANMHYNENVSSRMKSTMANHYLLYTKRAWDLETSYDKLMSRLFRGVKPEEVWSIVELKKEELKNTTYTERKYFRFIVLRDAEYARKYDERFDIRGTLYSEQTSRIRDEEIAKIPNALRLEAQQKFDAEKRVERMIEYSRKAYKMRPRGPQGYID